MRKLWLILSMIILVLLLLTPVALAEELTPVNNLSMDLAMDQMQNERGSVEIPSLNTSNIPTVPITTTANTNKNEVTTSTDTEISTTSAVLFSSDNIEVSRGLSPSASLIKSLIGKALQLQGIRYSYSGTTTKGFDCSGFVYYVFKQFGIDLPHSSRGQADLGIHIDKSSLGAGDLVFFNTGGSSRISHVGIYIGGNRFIHASTNKGITITSLNESYYARNYVGARRIIGID